MNNGLKALLLAASTIITCIIVGLGFQMAREAKQIGNLVVDDLHQYKTALEERDLMKYDGVTVYGNDVVNLMKAELSEDGTGIWVTVTDGNRSITYKERNGVKKVQEIGTLDYIMPTAEYVGEVIRNENEVIIEIVFKKTEKMEESKI